MPVPGVCMSIVKERQKNDGVGTISSPEKFLHQDFEHLKQFCAIRQVRFIDEMFPPDQASIGGGFPRLDLSRVVWKRPREIETHPALVVDGISRFDVMQGYVGNCWFLASIGALTFQKPVFQQVLPLNQSFDRDYCGIFHVRFWRFGRWIDVVIDDKLPTIDGKLIFVHSKDPREFWPALVEKAYAKVCGSYTDMNSGSPSEALVDFTGGVHVRIKLSAPPPNLWELMYRAGRSNALMGCGTPLGKTSANEVLPNGLVQGHAYTVTGIKQVVSKGQVVDLVRLWNPWGKTEWNGDWCDRSPLWKNVRPEDREMCLVVADDGEFWMSLEEFLKCFDDLDICCQCPNFLDEDSSCHWSTQSYEGRWVAGTTAGGSLKYPESFWTNPQYRVTVGKRHRDSAEEEQAENSMLVMLMQKPDKRNRSLVKNLHIGFSVFEVPEESKTHMGKFPAAFFSPGRQVALTKEFLNARGVMEFFSVKPGEYLIVPSTFHPSMSGSFLLTILSKSETHVHETSRGHDHENVEVKKSEKGAIHENQKTLFRLYSDEYEEVDAEMLQRILNENILAEDLKCGGFSTDACRSMVALMDSSITGKLNAKEFVLLWKKVVLFKDIFFHADVSRTGTLSLSELRNALMATGKTVSDEILNLVALRYGTSSGHITLESFLTLALRFDCMKEIFKQLSHGGNTISLHEPEWMYLSIYT